MDRIPKRVMDSLKARFPQAEIRKWTREEEGGTVLYDIEFRQEGRKCEADIKEDGTIHNWEKEIAARDLPDVVRRTVERKYPKGVFTEIMAITAVTSGKETLEGYEIVVKTPDKGETEVTVAPDGKILEESGAR
ncbi:MAG: PepSY-like domain-containing protein [Acidobacteria bacterium]|nr:PepSY-like domain-containing protein [Acidobacteriota bacterium]